MVPVALRPLLPRLKRIDLRGEETGDTETGDPKPSHPADDKAEGVIWS